MKHIPIQFNNKVVFIFIFIISFCYTCKGNENKEERLIELSKKHFIFGDYDFDSNDYSLYIIEVSSKNNNPSINLYTKDSSLLNQLKSLWVYQDESYGRCAPKYTLYLKRNDTICMEFEISVECNEIFIEGKQFQFNANDLFLSYLKKFQALYKYNLEFNNLKTRSEVLSKICKKNIVLEEITSPPSIKYEHIYRFNYIIKVEYEKRYNYYEKSIIKILYEQIKNKYPGEAFWLECNYAVRERESEMNTYLIDLYCNKTLFNKFNIYKKIENYESVPLKLSFFSTTPL